MEVQDVHMTGPEDIDMHAAEEAEMAMDPQAGEEDEEAAGSDEPGEPTAGDDDEDSSEEEEENEEEMRKVAQGFIVDEEEEEEESEEEDRKSKRRHKKKRRRHRRREEEEDLDEEDLDLLEENMGYGRKLTRIRRGRIGSDEESGSPEPAPSRQATRASPGVDLNNIWEEPREDDMDVEDYMDDFIVDEGEEGEMDEEERKERRRVERERRRAMGARPDMDGLDAAAWDEIFEVFGDGRDYEWALEGEDANEEADEAPKPDMKYTDVFEPSEIKARHLTEDDDIIRMTDIPERMQLSTSSLSPSATLTLHDEFDFSQHLSAAAAWVAMRISPRITRDFFRQGAPHQALLTPLIIAISRILEFMLIRNFEVPYIFTHHHDLISHFDYEKRVMTELLSRDELWRVGILGMKFRALTERRETLYKTYEKMGVHDDYFDSDLKDHLDSIEAVADTSEWLGMKYRQALKDAMEMPEDDTVDVSKRIKKPTRISPYETAKSTIASKLADGFGIPSADIVRNFISKSRKIPTVDQDITPVAYADEYVTDGPAGVTRDAEKQLELARLIIATEIGKDPLVRQRIRTLFEGSAVISCLPTEKGVEKIDEFHPYMNFKYLKEKPIEKMKDSPQFLHLLQAEHDHLVTVNVKLHDQALHVLERDLSNSFSTDGTGPISKAWNAQRKLVVTEALEKHLLPLGAKWAREWLREEIEDSLAKKCGDSLQDRINRAPYRTEDIEPGDVPSVMGISWGKGDPQKDAVHIVVLDEEGRLRDHLKLDNLLDEDLKEQFTELIKRRNPDVIVVGGFTALTKKLMDQVKLLVNGPPDPSEDKKGAPNGQTSSKPQAASSDPTGNWGALPAATDGWGVPSSGANDPWGAPATQSAATDAWGASANGDWGSGAASGDWGAQSSEPTPAPNPASSSPERLKSKDKSKEKEERKTPIFYVNDEVARIYQHSKRAEDEYGRIPLLGRYCVGLARYVQSPLNEYAALGSDLAAISFDECQTLVPKDKLFVAFERALVNVVNTVGVDINRAGIDSYYQTLLPFVAGLGPRKAEQLIQRIASLGGTLVNRSQLIHENILGMTIFLNSSGFLRISRDMSYRKSSKKRKKGDSTDAVPDPLDDTRIHPEDYDLAKQMALDALEIDLDDVEDDAQAAQFIGKLMEDPDNAKKLNVLNLDDFAATLFKSQGKEKRHTLDMIKQELLRPFGERRKEFLLPDKWEILTMLTGETESTLQRGKIVSVSVARVKSNFVAVRMDSGLDGVLAAKYLSNDGHAIPEQVVQKGQAIPAVIIAVYVDEFRVEFSARPMDIQTGDAHTRRIPLDECYDKVLMERNKDIADRKKRREVDQIRRIIKHPNFHNLNYKQAEELLSHQQRGDVVIRPSTKGPDHLAVTWKVDNGLYQHIDVVEPNADITSQNVGTHLVVEGKYQFSDLDELIVNHVKAMARRVEELMVHEKFMKGTDSEIHVELDQKIRGMRNQRSVYAFGLNRDRPGWFKLHFKANTMSPIQMMLVKVTPNGYQLDGQEFGSVSDLCDGFKTKVGRMGGVAGAQTPYGSARTPAMTPGRGAGGTTPGHMSSRQTPGHASSRLNPNMGKTPNPYAASAAKTPNPYAPPGPGGGGGRPPVPTSAPGAGWGAPPGGSSWGAPSSNAGGWGQSPAPQRGGPQPPPSGGGTPAGMHPSRVARLNAANSHGNDWGSNRF